MLVDVTKVTPREDFILFLEFENGEKGEFDCKTLFDKKPFQVLQNEVFFKKVKNTFGTVSWNEDIDIAPETLYIESKKIDGK